MNNVDRFCIITIGFCVGLIFAFIIYAIGTGNGASATQKEALQAGVGCYKPDGIELKPKFTFDCKAKP